MKDNIFKHFMRLLLRKQIQPVIGPKQGTIQQSAGTVFQVRLSKHAGRCYVYDKKRRGERIGGNTVALTFMEVVQGYLSSALEVAVPLHVMQLQARGGPSQEDVDSCAAIAELLGSKGDLLMFRGRKRGETADVFNALARGIAILSFCPGGVTLFGEHWESRKEAGSDDSASFMKRLLRTRMRVLRYVLKAPSVPVKLRRSATPAHRHQSRAEFCVFLSCNGSTFTGEPVSPNPQAEISKSRTERCSGRQRLKLESLAQSYWRKYTMPGQKEIRNKHATLWP